MLGVLLVVALLGTQLRCQGRRDANLAGARNVVGTRALQRHAALQFALTCNGCIRHRAELRQRAGKHALGKALAGQRVQRQQAIGPARVGDERTDVR